MLPMLLKTWGTRSEPVEDDGEQDDIPFEIEPAWDTMGYLLSLTMQDEGSEPTPPARFS